MTKQTLVVKYLFHYAILLAHIPGFFFFFFSEIQVVSPMGILIVFLSFMSFFIYLICPLYFGVVLIKLF